MADVVVATRFFEKDISKAPAAIDKLNMFCEKALGSGAKHVLVAVNVAEDISGTVERQISRVTLFPVQPWGKIAMPLNALLVAGREYWAKGSLLLLASAEVTLSEDVLETLISHMDNETLVVGAALLGHEYKPGIYERASGRQTPWNTLALWDPWMLWAYGGFPLLADGPIDDSRLAGMEEAITIASIQSRTNFTAKLVEVPGQNWDTSGFTGERLEAHNKKMTSKNSRPAAQLAIAVLPNPTVAHI